MFWQWNKVRLAFLFPVLLGLTGLLTGCTGKNELEIRDLSVGGETSVTGGSSSDREDSSILGKGEGFLPGYGSREDGGQSVGSASSQEAGGSAQQEKSGEGSPATSQVRIKVFVCGAVSQEGVYELESASRVIDAVQAAGGFSGNADSRYVNQAAPLTDGMKLCIPTKAEIDRNILMANKDTTDAARQEHYSYVLKQCAEQDACRERECCAGGRSDDDPCPTGERNCRFTDSRNGRNSSAAICRGKRQGESEYGKQAGTLYVAGNWRDKGRRHTCLPICTWIFFPH